MLFAREVKAFVCIRCPLGCQLEVVLDTQGALEEATGYQCKLGREYAQEEAVAPKRMVCAALCVTGSLEPMSVKTAQPVPKERIAGVLDALAALAPMLAAPIAEGTVLVDNIAGTGVAILATKTIEGESQRGAGRGTDLRPTP